MLQSLPEKFFNSSAEEQEFFACPSRQDILPQIELHDGYRLKRHIDQLRSTKVPQPNPEKQPGRTVPFSPEPHNQELEDVIDIPLNQPDAEHPENHPVPADNQKPEPI
ncbi:hypothetical protein QE152_g7261 [Popillia japonica]|uniref:Uncharacterized protein n=1 Tax=Popillia japonica TaxID=7064 RepID=A0AAW1MFX6_POPJA